MLSGAKHRLVATEGTGDRETKLGRGETAKRTQRGRFVPALVLLARQRIPPGYERFNVRQATGQEAAEVQSLG